MGWYKWYAGNIDTSSGSPQYIPIEFGAANLLPSDVLNHYQHGLFGALVIEPKGATCSAGSWTQCTGVAAQIYAQDRSFFQEFVAISQDGLPPDAFLQVREKPSLPSP